MTKHTLLYRAGGRYCIEKANPHQLKRQYDIDDPTAKRWLAIQGEFEGMQHEIEQHIWGVRKAQLDGIEPPRSSMGSEGGGLSRP